LKYFSGNFVSDTCNLCFSVLIFLFRAVMVNDTCRKIGVLNFGTYTLQYSWFFTAG